LQNWANPLNRIETLKFADGSTLTVAGMVSKLGTEATTRSRGRRARRR
jgi:hypothetical protein